MSLLEKLETDNLHRTCQRQVEDLHELFVSWFQGTRSRSVLEEELKDRLDTQFSHVAPNGQLLRGRHVLISHLQDKYGCYANRVFSIDIYDVQLLWQSPTECLCTYEEWQSWQQDESATEVHQFGRLSTCLLTHSNNTSWQWVHVHETWLEADAPQHPPKQKAKQRYCDEETIMTGPVLPHQLQERTNTEEKTFLMLISNQSTQEQEMNQERAETILAVRQIPYETIDGDNSNPRRRNELFALSGIQDDYPQFFLVADNRTMYWGDYDDLQMAHDNETLVGDLSALGLLVDDNNKQDNRENESDEEESIEAFGSEEDNEEPGASAAGALGPVPDEMEEEEEESMQFGTDDDDNNVETAAAAALGVAAVAGVATAAAMANNNESSKNGTPAWTEQEDSIQIGQESNSFQVTPESAPPKEDFSLELEPEEVANDDEKVQAESNDFELEMEPEEEPIVYNKEIAARAIPIPESEAEKSFLEASQGILEFEEEEEEGMAAEKEDEKPEASSIVKDANNNSMSPIPQDISSKRHVSQKLEKYAKPLTWENTLVGISIAGFDIGTSQGPIADEKWYRETGNGLEALAQCRSSSSSRMPRRKLALPEMVFPTAHVALEGHGIWMSWDVFDCLEDWAKCHQGIPVDSSVENRGVSVIKSKHAKLWADKKYQTSDSSVPSVFHYDWTYSTAFPGNVEGGEWVELDESGMRIELLTDQSVPILFFDEIVLYEDDLHDNGQVQYAVKLRVMPTCAYVLARLFVRVDNVLVRMREARVLVDFFGIAPQIYRDVTWRECKWGDLAANGLPNDVRSWHYEGRETPELNALMKSIPSIDPPEGIYTYSMLQMGKSKGAQQTNKDSERLQV